MKIEVDRYTIHIIPETAQDVAFIVDTMKLGSDGDEIKLERIDIESEPMGFRLETDISPYPAHYNRGDTRPIKEGLYQRPLADFIDCEGSWDGPPYSRSSAKHADVKREERVSNPNNHNRRGDTKVDSDAV
tara:strand:- start:1022 stop:1414 length:393 start_codon:yes stop_codon:yes gene_type:complete